VTRLRDVASLIRSKNAGPFVLTIDILFDTDEVYQQVVKHPALSQENVASLLGIPVDDIRLVPYPAGQAIKVSFPRPVVAGSPDDTDVTGGQQYAVLVDLDVSESAST